MLDAMTRSGRFDSEDVRSLEHVILGFLREPAPALWGSCSYARNHRSARNAGERTWRVLINRSLLQRSDDELRKTLYHEFLHAILGSDEGHGPNFQGLKRCGLSVVDGPGARGARNRSFACSQKLVKVHGWC